MKKLSKSESIFVTFVELDLEANPEKACNVCELQGTFCEGVRCESASDKYINEIDYYDVIDDIKKDVFLRGRYNNLSLSEKIKLKKNING